MLEMMLTRILKKPNAPGNEPGNEPGLEIDPGVFEKLLASDGAVSDYFGASVAASVDGSTIVVGACYDDNDKGRDSGSAYVFTKQANGSYLETQKLLASDGAVEDYFGYSVAVSGDSSTVVVGAYRDDDKGFNSGSVYVFTKQANGSYLQAQKLIASDGASNDYFGWTVAVSGDGSTVVVGAHEDDSKGSAYIFTKQANESYLQAQKLIASDGALYDYFGYSVAVSGDGTTVIVGAYEDDDKYSGTGSVYVFTKQEDESYVRTQKLLATSAESGDNFGISVAISGDGSTIVVGAYKDDDKGLYSGSAYIFTKQANESYLHAQKLLASDGASKDYFGNSVSVSGDGSTVVVGAYFDDDKGTDSGSAYVFTKQLDGSYLETHKLVATDGAANNQFGRSVAISNTSVVISTPSHLNKGAVYVY